MNKEQINGILDGLENSGAPVNFRFDIEKKGKPTMTWTQRGFTFNKDAIELLGSPAYIAFGLDRKNKRLAIKEADDSLKDRKYAFANSERREKWAFVSATNIREALSELLNERPEKGGISFAVQFDKIKKFGIIDLTKGTVKEKPKEGGDNES